MAMVFLLGLSGCLHLGFFGITRHRQSEMAVCCSDNDTSDGIGAFLHRHILGGNFAHCDLGPVPCIGHVDGMYPMQHQLEHASVLQFNTSLTCQVQVIRLLQGPWGSLQGSFGPGPYKSLFGPCLYKAFKGL